MKGISEALRYPRLTPVSYGKGVQLKPIDPGEVLASCFILSAVAGLAALLKSVDKLTVRGILAAILWNGVVGLIIGLAWFNWYKESNILFLVALAGFMGLGIVSSADVLKYVFRSVAVKSTKASSQEDYWHGYDPPETSGNPGKSSSNNDKRASRDASQHSSNPGSTEEGTTYDP